MPLSSSASDTAPYRILVVDDDASLRREVAHYLADHDYEVEEAADVAAMDRKLAAQPVDLIVLDVMMPGEDGLSACRRLAGGPASILMMSAMGDPTDRIIGLELGADDYLAKPVVPRELLARVKAMLRRNGAAQPVAGKSGGYVFAGFSLDVVRRQLRAPDGTTVLLTAGEFSLLGAFLDHPRRVLSREQLLDYARGLETDVFDRAVDVQLSRLRRKVHAHTTEELFKTLRGAGYMLDTHVTRA